MTSTPPSPARRARASTIRPLTPRPSVPSPWVARETVQGWSAAEVLAALDGEPPAGLAAGLAPSALAGVLAAWGRTLTPASIDRILAYRSAWVRFGKNPAVGPAEADQIATVVGPHALEVHDGANRVLRDFLRRKLLPTTHPAVAAIRAWFHATPETAASMSRRLERRTPLATTLLTARDLSASDVEAIAVVCAEHPAQAMPLEMAIRHPAATRRVWQAALAVGVVALQGRHAPGTRPPLSAVLAALARHRRSRHDPVIRAGLIATRHPAVLVPVAADAGNADLEVLLPMLMEDPEGKAMRQLMEHGRFRYRTDLSAAVVQLLLGVPDADLRERVILRLPRMTALGGRVEPTPDPPAVP